jgi:L-rhamnose mutarotase
MALTDVNARWQAEMAALFEDSGQAPDAGFRVLEEVFNLDSQLAAGAG